MLSSLMSTNTGGLLDTAPPFGVHHSARYIRSFAHSTMKNRLPTILTGIIENMNRREDSIIKKYGPDSSNELKEIIKNLIQLKDELTTNKPLKLLDLIDNGKDRDAMIWNEYIKTKSNIYGISPTWYNTVWYFGESYMYRRVAQIFAFSRILSKYDPFKQQKIESFIGFNNVINWLAKYVTNLLKYSENYSLNSCKNDFNDLLKLNLWGNRYFALYSTHTVFYLDYFFLITSIALSSFPIMFHTRCDLSLSNGAPIEAEMENSIQDLKMFENCLLIDNCNTIWDLLIQAKEIDDDVIIDVVLDNAGYELFTDICFAIFLTVYKFAQKIRFYVKAIPWFVSDTTQDDFIWTINAMKNSSDAATQALGHKCLKYLENGKWTIEVESFWTEPFDFAEMKIRSPELYAKLAQASLIIFKGDLNYRKLLGDINWDYETNLIDALRGFKPTNMALLRTIKADLIVGLSHAKVAELFTKQENWMLTGQYGIIHTVIV